MRRRIQPDSARARRVPSHRTIGVVAFVGAFAALPTLLAPFVARPVDGTTLASHQLDLATCTAEELSALPGIGPALADRVIGSREQDGEFARVDELDRVRGIGPSTLDAIRPFVVARPRVPVP